MKFNFALMAHVLGVLILFNGLFMWLCLPFSFYYGEDVLPLLLSGTFSIAFGSGLLLSAKHRKGMLGKREVCLVVVLGWVLMSLSGMLPYLVHGCIPGLTDAFFETLSGYSTTGATILTDIESLPKDILLWRSLTQWIGGMGIVVLVVAVMPLIGTGGMQLFLAEAPGISTDKLRPRIKDTAKQLWYLYLGLTLTEAFLLFVAGMPPFDALNHALTTMATGGFSIKNDSIAAYPSPLIQYIIIVFMLFAGTNFTILYFLVKGQIRRLFRNDECTFYYAAVLLLATIVAMALYPIYGNAEEAVRLSLFQVVSVITTTGYITADYTAWKPFLTVLFFTLLFLGASAGSTSGGIKLIRIIVLLKNAIIGLKKEIHTHLVAPLYLNGKTLKPETVLNVLAFVMLYLTFAAGGATVLSLFRTDFETSLGAVVTCLSNVGPGLGLVGPSGNFSAIPGAGKWLLAFFMLLGRLEIFTVLIILTPYFWRRHI